MNGYALHTLNETIVRNESEASEANLKSYRTALHLKEQELEAHILLKPLEREPPVDDPDDERTREAIAKIRQQEATLAALHDEIAAHKEERTTLTAEQTRIRARVKITCPIFCQCAGRIE